MIDVDLIHQCADPRIEVAIVQQFVDEMNAQDHLTVRVYHGVKMVLVPSPKTVEEALETTKEWVDKADVRVGLTQYPAGLGIADPSGVSVDLFDPCKNLRLGTELFGKLLRIVDDREGVDDGARFQTAVKAYFTGWFEGDQVFYARDPVQTLSFKDNTSAQSGVVKKTNVDTAEPAQSGIRVDLSGLKQALSGD